MIVMQRQTDLLEVIRALCSSRRFAGRLDCREQQGDQDADDRYHHQQLDERKRSRGLGDWGIRGFGGGTG